MVRAFERRNSIRLSRSFKKMFELSGRHNSVEDRRDGDDIGDVVQSRNFVASNSVGSPMTHDQSPMKSQLMHEGAGNKKTSQGNSDMELMKEKFAKLLLGEDMSGGGKGVSSALALSNAITNLAASVFGESHKLEPMAPDRKARWRKEMDWLLSVTDHIVEFVPSQQVLKNGTKREIMVTRQRNDLHMNIPALRKLDAMLADCLDKFVNQNEFWYASSKDDKSENGKTPRKDDKWWLPVPQVPSGGLSDKTKKFMQVQKESVNQVLKASMAINAQVLAEMEIPESYIESLPKNGRSSLGDGAYRCITDEVFDPEQFLSTVDLTTEHKVLDLKNRIEASIIIWKRKMNNKDSKSTWGSAVSIEKRELFEERAETILMLLKHQFPGLPQSSLDISKIQYNRDVGQAILESYSRVLESLASAVMNRIEDVLYADSLAQNSTTEECNKKPPPSPTAGQETISTPQEETDTTPKAASPTETPNSKTLSEFMGWYEQEEPEMKKTSKDENEKFYCKPLTMITNKKFSYLERLENLSGLRSPTARH